MTLEIKGILEVLNNIPFIIFSILVNYKNGK